MQKLDTLHLDYNEISTDGAQNLADALQNNTVNNILSSCSFDNRYFLIKTLTELNLDFNKIGDKGLKHLTDALQNNKVNSISHFSHDYIFLMLFVVTHYNRPGR